MNNLISVKLVAFMFSFMKGYLRDNILRPQGRQDSASFTARQGNVTIQSFLYGRLGNTVFSEVKRRPEDSRIITSGVDGLCYLH